MRTYFGTRIKASLFAWRRMIGILFLTAQFCGIVLARFYPLAWPQWAPNDTLIEYVLSAESPVYGRLSAEQVKLRYGLPAEGFLEQPLIFLTTTITQREIAAKGRDRVDVRLTYSLNGRRPAEWMWASR